MKRAIPILAAILGVQIIIYLIVSIDRHYETTKKPFLAIDTSMVDYIKIRNEDGELAMKKVGVNWKITDPFDDKANQSYVQTLLEKVTGLTIETFITDNPDKYTLYELDELAAKYIEIGKEGGLIDSFYCGKSSESYTHTYLRKADTDDVYLVTGTPRSSLTRQPTHWRDKQILALDRTLIERILLKFPLETVELIRQITSPEMDSTLTEADTTWQAIPQRGIPFKPEDKVINRILNTLKRLNATDFIDAKTDTIPDFSKPDFTIEVFLEGDEHHTIDFIPQPDSDNRWIARKDGEESTVFIVYQSSVNNLKKDPAALRGEEKEDT